MARKTKTTAATGADLTRPDDYPVGYGRPPIAHRFKPGVSGNPKGRPKGRKSPGAVLRGLLDEMVTVNTPNGQKRMTKLEAIGRQSLARILKGDAKGLQIFTMLDRHFGEPISDANAQPAEVSQSEKDIINNFAARLRARPIIDDDGDES